MLEAIKRLLGLEKLPKETERIFLEAKDEEIAKLRTLPLQDLPTGESREGDNVDLD